MTKRIFFKGLFSPFHQWINENPKLDSIKLGLSIGDIDLYIHQYKDPKFCKVILLEEKVNGREIFSDSQRDSLSCIDQFMQFGDGKTIKTFRGNKIGKYYGFHTLVLERDTPDNSEWMKFDGKIISKEVLVKILRLNYDPKLISNLEYLGNHKTEQ